MKTVYHVSLAAYGTVALDVVFTRKPEREEIVQLVYDKNKDSYLCSQLVELATNGHYSEFELECYD